MPCQNVWPSETNLEFTYIQMWLNNKFILLTWAAITWHWVLARMRISGMQPEVSPAVTTLSGNTAGRVQYNRTLGGHFQLSKTSGIGEVSLITLLAKVAGANATETSSASADDTRTFFITTAISTNDIEKHWHQQYYHRHHKPMPTTEQYWALNCSVGTLYIYSESRQGRAPPMCFVYWRVSVSTGAEPRRVITWLIAGGFPPSKK